MVQWLRLCAPNAGVQSLVGELRSCMLSSVAKKKKRERERQKKKKHHNRTQKTKKKLYHYIENQESKPYSQCHPNTVTNVPLHTPYTQTT